MVLYEPRDRFTVSNDSFVSNKSPEISLNSDNKSISEAGIVKKYFLNNFEIDFEKKFIIFCLLKWHYFGRYKR